MFYARFISGLRDFRWHFNYPVFCTHDLQFYRNLGRGLLGLVRNRNIRNGGYLYSFGSDSVFGMIILFIVLLITE